MQFKNTYELANNIIDYYLDESIKFQAMKFGFTCYVDYGSGGLAVIDIFKKEVEKRRINWLHFTPVDKTTMYLRDRIDWDTICMIKGILSINWKRCPNTHEELSKMQWLAKSKLENSNNEPQMLDLYDNCWDARMYASMHKMKWLINNINNELLINKNKF